MRKGRLRETHALSKVTQQVGCGAFAPQHQTSEGLLVAACVLSAQSGHPLYFTGWATSTYLAVLLSSECEKFPGIFLLSIVAVLPPALLSCFQVPKFMCYLSVIFRHLPLHSFKRVIKHWACCMCWRLHCWYRIEKKYWVETFFFFLTHSLNRRQWGVIC